jgi:hypothetical protein
MEKAVFNGNPIKKLEALVDNRKRKYDKKNSAVPHELPFDKDEEVAACLKWLDDEVNAKVKTCYDMKIAAQRRAKSRRRQ